MLGRSQLANRKKLNIYLGQRARKKNASQIIVKNSYKTASASAGAKHRPLGVRPALARLLKPLCAPV